MNTSFYKSLVCLILVLVTLMSMTIPAFASEPNDYTFIFGTGDDDYYRIMNDNAPLRASSSNSGKIIVRLKKWQLVKVVDTFVTIKLAKWHKISYLDGSGRSCTAYLYAGNAYYYSSKVNKMCNYTLDLYEKNGIYRTWGITKEDILKEACTDPTKYDVEVSLLFLLKQRLDKSVGKTMDISSYDHRTYYSYYDSNGIYRKNWGMYEIYGGCTWYAFNRFREVNGHDLIFKGSGGGNANTWDDRIMTDTFQKIRASELKNMTTNAVGVDNQGSPLNGVYYGHVVYIEAVLGGNVYFSEGWYGNGFKSRLRMMSINDFAKTYETVILQK